MREDQVNLICDSIETFCASLLKRLEKEEQELFAIARNAIAGETWFSIANQLMMHDKHLEDMKRSGLTPVEAVEAAKPKAVAARNLAGSVLAADDGQISIPGLQVLPIVHIEETGAAAAPGSLVRSTRQLPAMK